MCWMAGGVICWTVPPRPGAQHIGSQSVPIVIGHSALHAFADSQTGMETGCRSNAKSDIYSKTVRIVHDTYLAIRQQI